MAYGGGYLSKENTQIIKGIFIIIVFFSHFNGYVQYTTIPDKMYQAFFTVIGQMMVTMFLFYSGYGVMESVKKKGEAYVKRIPLHRVLETLLKFDCAILLFIVANTAFGNPMPISRIVLSFVAWDSIGNSNWYIFTILVLYLLSFLAATIAKCDQRKTVLYMLLFTIVYIIVMMLVRFESAQFYNTAICYPLGMAYSIYRNQIETFLLSTKKQYLLITVILLVITVVVRFFIRTGTSPLIIIEAIPFSLVIVFLSMKLPIKSRILQWCGNYLFELYILQRLPMMIYKNVGLSTYNIYVYFILSLITTALLAVAFRKSTAWIKI
jgi:hypothetical protein